MIIMPDTIISTNNNQSNDSDSNDDYISAESSLSEQDNYKELKAYDNKLNLKKDYTVHNESEDVFELEKEFPEIP